MALDDIVRKISEDAQSEADSLLSLARAEADAIREKAERNCEEVRSDMMQAAEESAKERASRIETLAGLELRKDTLKEKKSLIQDMFEQAKTTIVNLPPGEYLALVRPIILNAVESGNEEIIPSAAHRGLFTPDFLNGLNDELGPHKGRLRLSEESGDFSGGFILREGKKETNLTLDSLIESRRDNMEPEIATILFGEGKKDG